jgi:MFS family permease
MSRTKDPASGDGRTRELSFSPKSPAGFYAAAGLIGAAAGLITGFISKSFESVLLYGLRLGVVAACLGAALFYAMGHARDWRPRPEAIAKVAVFSFLAGLFSGGLALGLYNVWGNANESFSWIVDFSAWTLLGALLGAVLSLLDPSTTLGRAISVGLLSGVVAGLVRWSGSIVGLSAPASSLIGLLVFGATIGLLTYIVRRPTREPTLEVHWSQQKVTTVGLGARPVTVGGGADDIVLPGAPPTVSIIVMENGVIEHIETSTGNRTLLNDGSRLRIGGVVLVVHAPE